MPNQDIRHYTVRRRNILYLIQEYLRANGLQSIANALKIEARLSEDFELCDNVDLDTIYLEFVAYSNLKFGKPPKILKLSCRGTDVNTSGVYGGCPPGDGSLARRKRAHSVRASGAGSIDPSPSECAQPENELEITVTQLSAAVESASSAVARSPMTGPAAGANIGAGLNALCEVDHGSSANWDEELFRNPEWQHILELVRSTMLRDDLKLRWSDMSGNKRAVDTVKEAVVAPIMFPELFARDIKPWRSMLLHGPPGTGKTLLAKILYNETRSKVSFFNITSSIVVSKWRGDSEKIIKMLFNLAAKSSPAIIFFDEIEGLTSNREKYNDHEASKRFKNELLQLLDGMEQHCPFVFILATTNMPWDIDKAFLRRFEKKMLIQLSNPIERITLIKKLLPSKLKVTDVQLNQLIVWSEHFTGDEIRLACKEVSMQVIRQSICGAMKPDVDIEGAFKAVKPICKYTMQKHIDWQAENGSTNQ